MLLGIDVGGTHTDAVLVSTTGLVAWAKAKTNHADLLASIREVLTRLLQGVDPASITRLNLSTTLSTNAIVEGNTEAVGVFVVAGPGVDPACYAFGDHYYTIAGSTDHRGRVVQPLNVPAARKGLDHCRQAGLRVFAGAAKFSTRNPEFEQNLKEILHFQADFVSLGHEFTGQLGFGRRINTAAYNASVWRIFNRFADAVQRSALEHGIRAQLNILKADGGTMPLSMSRAYPVESILSGPAASVMGIIAMCDITCDSVILDIGGTTTDIAVFASGAPLIEEGGAIISGRPTQVRALKTRSIGIGGDSAITVLDGAVRVGPRRLGPAMAEGGVHPTLVDALNVLETSSVGDPAASRQGIAALAATMGCDARTLALDAVLAAVTSIRAAVTGLLAEINDRPVYTIYELLEDKRILPERVYVMGGPAQAMAGMLAEVFHEQVIVPEGYAVANAVGAAVSRPTFSAELFADTERGRMLIPSLEVDEDIPPTYDLARAKLDAASHLREYLAYLGLDAPDAFIETLEAQSFNMVVGDALAGRTIRVKCQIKPGVLPGYRQGLQCGS